MFRPLCECSEAFRRDWLVAMHRDIIIDEAAFFAMAGDKTGQGLIRLMQWEVFEKLAIEQELTMEGNGEWLSRDENLFISGGDNPAGLGEILKNMRRSYDPLRETDMFDNMSYKNSSVSTLKRQLEESWKATINDKVKKVRTPKQIAAGAGEGAVEADAAKPDEKSAKEPRAAKRRRYRTAAERALARAHMPERRKLERTERKILSGTQEAWLQKQIGPLA